MLLEGGLMELDVSSLETLFVLWGCECEADVLEDSFIFVLRIKV